jgi:hypothetical protein
VFKNWRRELRRVFVSYSLPVEKKTNGFLSLTHSSFFGKRRHQRVPFVAKPDIRVDVIDEKGKEERILYIDTRPRRDERVVNGTLESAFFKVLLLLLLFPGHFTAD